jgi:hypothetical protein
MVFTPNIMLLISIFSCFPHSNTTFSHSAGSKNNLQTVVQPNTGYCNLEFELVVTPKFPQTVVQPNMGYFFQVFVLFGAYGLLNLIVGVIVESSLTQAKMNKESGVRWIKEWLRWTGSRGWGELIRSDSFQCSLMRGKMNKESGVRGIKEWLRWILRNRAWGKLGSD